MTGVVNPAINAHGNHPNLGVLVTYDTLSNAGKQVDNYGTFLLDNCCFTQAKPWSEPKWVASMDRFTPEQKARCVMATAPDVVGSHERTVERSSHYFDLIRSKGLPAGFVAQNGATPENTPWDRFDALFLGGVLECLPCGYTKMPTEVPEGRDPATWYRVKKCPMCGARMTEWKESEAARAMVVEAKRRGMWVHMGRVQTPERINICAAWGVDSADGTYLRFGNPHKGVAEVLGWVNAIRQGRKAERFAGAVQPAFAGMA